MEPYSLIDSRFLKWLGFLATLTSATLLLFLLFEFRRIFRRPFWLKIRLNREISAILQGNPRANSAAKIIDDFDYLLRYFRIRQATAYPGTLERITPNSLLRLDDFAWYIRTRVDQSLTKSPVWGKNLREIELVFDFELSDGRDSAPLSLRYLNVEELNLCTTALVCSQGGDFRLEFVRTLGKTATSYLTNSSGKTVPEFGESEARKLIAILGLYLPAKGQAQFASGVSFVLPKPGESLTWDEHEFILTAFIDTWRNYHEQRTEKN